MRYFKVSLLLAALTANFALSGVVSADQVPATDTTAPASKVILTIKGQMTPGTASMIAEFDLAKLRDMGAVTFSTSTPWTTGVQDFTGVPVYTLLKAIGANPSSLKITALNEYEVVIPASDAIEGGPMLAWEQGGRYLSVREKGPLWLVYPFDKKTEYQTEEIHARAVWQVVQIELLP